MAANNCTMIGEPAIVLTSQCTYEPWTDGHAVGFKVTRLDGTVQYVYLNPSAEDPGQQPDVFVYKGPDGHPGMGNDQPECYVNVWDDFTGYAFVDCPNCTYKAIDATDLAEHRHFNHTSDELGAEAEGN